MLRHLLIFATVITMVVPGATLRAAEYANPYALLPRCPDDPGATPIVTLGKAMNARDPFKLSSPVGGEKDAEGNMIVKDAAVSQGDRTLKAKRLQLNQDETRFDVSGEVEYRDPQLIVRGDTGSLSEGEASFDGVTFELPLQPARGRAKSLSQKDGIVKLGDGRYTTCPEDRPDWLVSFDTLSINTNTSVGIARGARLRFFGVTILRLPYVSFPVGNARKSGLLFPSIGTSSNSGAQVSVPYYFNIAPNQDLTLTPTWYTSRGLDVEAEYRFLTQSTRGEFKGNVLPDDRKTGRTRTRMKIGSSTQLPHGWRLTLDGENVSDARYFEDFAQGADGASIAFLPRRLQLSYRDDHLDAGLILRHFQTLDVDLPQIDQPHTEVPRIYARGDWLTAGALPLNYGFDTEFVLFQHNDTVQGWRIDATPQVGLDFEGAGYFLKPAAALETTQYQLQHVAPGANRSPGRTLPMVSLDGGLQFERDSGRRGQRRMTLEPRLMYLYVPYRDQSDLPVFDTAEPDLNWVELFRTNRYAGIDRISDANQLAAGVTTRLFSSRTGTRFLSTTIGQAFYFSTPRVSLPDEPPLAGHKSDLIAQVELTAFKNWTVSSGLQWDEQESQTGKGEFQVRYQPESRSVVNVGYRYQRDRQEQVDFSTAWPVSDQWRIYGRSVYSLRDNKAIENFAGFEFSSCCWNVRAVARDYVSRRSGERDRSFFLQLELKGLSSVGQAADAFLENAIRGYSNTRQRR
ncbi:MAG: LPS assembly protein LptD [Pseudomonadota bacterium]